MTQRSAQETATMRRLHDGGFAEPSVLAEAQLCDACGELLGEERGGSGLVVWSRGEEVRREEPGLCPNCGCAIGLAALALWELEEDGGD